jgi:hypothetical protein
MRNTFSSLKYRCTVEFSACAVGDSVRRLLDDGTRAGGAARLAEVRTTVSNRTGGMAR